MLTGMRKFAGGWIAKIFMVVLVASFAVWGIADIFNGYGSTAVAQVGDHEISGQEFQEALQSELRSVRQRIGRSLSMQEASQFGIDQRVLDHLVAVAAIDEHARDLNLGISSKAIAMDITRDQNFNGTDGKFDQQRFRQILAANGLSEQGYVQRQRGASVRRQLTETVGSEIPAPETLIQAINTYRNQTRTLRYFAIPISSIPTVEAPSDKELKAYYDNNKQAFTAPEYRKIGFMSVTSDTVAGKLGITEKDLEQQFKAAEQKYQKPEKRKIQQIAFKDMAAAQKAYDKIESGTDFLDIAKAQGFSEDDITLGWRTRSEIDDTAVEETAFSVAEDTVSKPVKGKLATVILRVTDIQPGVLRSLADAKAEVRKDLVEKRAGNKIFELHDKIEDARAGGATIAEAAKQLGLKYDTATVDRDGNTPEGGKADIPAAAKTIQTAFESDIDVENDPVETTGHGYVWVNVVDITPEHLKPLADVRKEAVDKWTRAEEQKRLTKKAQDLAEKARKGQSLDDLASQESREIKTSKPLTRTDVDGPVSNAAVAQAFALGKGGYGSAPSPDRQARVVFEVADITQPKPLKGKSAKNVVSQLDTSLNNDLLTQYVSALRGRYGVSVNRTVMSRLLGTGS